MKDTNNQANAARAPALFVYGTLRRGFGNPFARRLRREASHLTTGTLSGFHLVDVGHYPGLVRCEDPAHCVTGDLFRLPDHPEPLLAELDAYEGCSTDPDVPGEYVRETARVNTGGESPVAAWIYRFNRNASHLPVVPDGDYLAYRGLCERCGRAGAEKFGGLILCGACIEAAGSCCTEFDSDD